MSTEPNQSAAEMWDQYLVWAQKKQASMPPELKQNGLATLPRRKGALDKPHLPRVRRVPEAILDALRGELRDLVTGKSPWPLYLHGKAGVGKTCAALCLLDYAGGEYHTVSGLCDLLIRAQQGRLEWSNVGVGGTLWPEQVWDKIAKAPLLVLDELGTREKVSDAHYEVVKTAIDERHGKPFVVISNHSLETVAALYDERIFSRLSAGTVLLLEGKDRRLES